MWTQLLCQRVVQEDWMRSYVTLIKLLPQIPFLFSHEKVRELSCVGSEALMESWGQGRGTVKLDFQPSRNPRRVKFKGSYGPGEMSAERTSVLGTVAITCLGAGGTSTERTEQENNCGTCSLILSILEGEWKGLCSSGLLLFSKMRLRGVCWGDSAAWGKGRREASMHWEKWKPP